jgi:hypothetical protein
MHKAWLISISAGALIGFIAIAGAAPAKTSLTFTDLGATLSVSGNLANLSSGNFEITLAATGTETVVCGDAGGTDPAPQEVVLTGSQVVAAPGGGNLAAFADLASSAPAAPACAPAADEAIAAQQDVTFTKVMLEVRPAQPDPDLAPLKPVRCIQCTFQGTVDGPTKPQSCFTLFTC